VEGQSLLDRQLAVLAAEGVDSVLMIGGYRAEMLQRPGMALRLNPRYSETNMVWTLFSAEEDLEGDILICYGDIVYSREILQAILQSDADISVTIDLEWESYWRSRNEDPLEDAETLKMHPDGRIYEIGKKPVSLADIEGQYMGLIKLSADGVGILKRIFHEAKTSGTLMGKSVEKAYMTDLLQAIINAGHTVTSVPIRAGWVEVDTVSDLQSSVTRQRLDGIAAAI
jgi:choline kinase